MFVKIRKNYEFHKKNFYRGNDIYCPFCSGTYKAQKFRFTSQTDTNCPVCGSSIEERTILLFLLAKTEILSGDPKILIVAEEGRLPEYFRNYPNADVKIYSAKGDFFIRDDNRKNEYETASFDLIVCNYILEKHPNHIRLLDELKRIIKPQGLLMLQANIDQEKEETAEYSHMYYKDRILLYGIADNLRRFGKNYPDFIRSQGLNMSRLKFSEGFEELPPLSFNKDEVFYIAHKTDQPVLFDNMDDLEAEMSDQRARYEPKWYGKYAYYLFFHLPDKVKGATGKYLSGVDESSANKSSWRYFIHMLILGTFSTIFGVAVYSLPLLINFPGNYLVFIAISTPLFLFCLTISFLCTGGYFFVNYKAGIVRRTIMGLYAATLLLISMAFAIMLLQVSVITIVSH